MRPATWIIVVNFNGWDDTVRCLRSLEIVQNSTTNVLLIDNGSRDDATSMIKAEFPWCRVLRSPLNAGWAGGNNLGIGVASAEGAENVLLLNNDTIVAPSVVERFSAAAAAHSRFGVFGSVVHSMSRPEEVQSEGILFNNPDEAGFFHRKPVPARPTDPPTIVEVDIVHGCCMFIRREAWERIGLMDERFFLIHEETDFCLRAAQAGFQCGVLAETLVWHKHSATFAKEGAHWQRYYDARNLYLLLSKHPRRRGRNRGWWRSRFAYLRQAYHYYCLDREEGRPLWARAILEGLLDAVGGVWGAYTPRRRRWLPGATLLFEVARRLKLRGWTETRPGR